MTTAHRPTFDPARGKSAPASHTFHTRSLPAFTHLKYRQRGQDGGDADDEGRPRDLAAELLAAEAAHFAKKSGGKQQQLPAPASVAGGWHPAASGESEGPSGKRELEDGGAAAAGESEDLEAKRRRILELTRAIDADEDEDEESDEDDEGSEKESEEEDDDDEDEDDDSDDDDAELRRELERVRREKQLERERKVRSTCCLTT